MASCGEQYCEIQDQNFQENIEETYEQYDEKNSEKNDEQNMTPEITVHDAVSSTSIRGQYNFDNSKQNRQIQSRQKYCKNLQSQHQKTVQDEQSHYQETIQANISKTSINGGELQFGEFQVFIHKISSKQSLNQNKIEFTKSQLEIPIDLEQDQNQPIQPQPEYVNIWKKQDPDDENDFYVKLLEEKWAKKQSQAEKIEKSQNQEKQPQSFGIFNVFKQLSKVTNQTSTTTQKKQKIQESSKKTFFKIKKVKQDNNRSSCSTLNVKNQKQHNRVSSNKSEFIKLKKEKSSIQLNRFTKKYSSDFQSAPNTPKKPKITTKKSEEKVQYEIFVGHKFERMNQILQDRSYNTILSHINPMNKENHSISNLPENKLQQIRNSQIPFKTVRKVIKRSPYGVLQLEVKDNKNHAKITNLRILKPKEIVRLKKVPRIVKNFKQNIFQ